MTASGCYATRLQRISVGTRGCVFEMCVTDNQLNSEEGVSLCTTSLACLTGVYVISHLFDCKV